MWTMMISILIFPGNNFVKITGLGINCIQTCYLTSPISLSDVRVRTEPEVIRRYIYRPILFYFFGERRSFAYLFSYTNDF